MIDNNREGLLNEENIRLFLSLNYYEASEDELRAIVRRIERKGTGTISFDEYRKAIEPVVVKMNQPFDDKKPENMSISPNGQYLN